MLEVLNVTKIYKSLIKKTLSCKDVSFIVKEGEITSLLGLNGAGKSTIIKIISGLVPPTKGDVIIEGKSIKNANLQAKREMGVLYENAPLYNDLSVIEFLLFSLEMRSIKRREAMWILSDLLPSLELEDVKNERIANLSKGYRQRVAFAGAVAHEPRVLILDEPTANLDTLQLKAFEKRILQMDKTKVVLISTHNLELARNICTRHILLQKGEVMLQGSIEELQEALVEEDAQYESLERDKVLEKAFEVFGGVKRSEFFKG